MTSWWSRFPWVLQREETALEEGGFRFQRDEAAFEKSRLVLKIQITLCGEAREVTAYYPDSFPYFAPRVLLEGARLDKHHNLEGGLCLLAEDSESWDPSSDTLARLLEKQLPIIEAANTPGLAQLEKAKLEELAGEPLSNFLPYASAPEVLLIPDELPPQGVMGGLLSLGLHPAIKGKGGVFGEIRTIANPSGAPLVTNSLLSEAFSVAGRGFWVRLPERPNVSSVMSHQELRTLFRDLVLAHSPAMRTALAAAKRGDVLVGGLLYKDDVSWSSPADDWVMLRLCVTVPRRGTQRGEYTYDFIRVDRGGEQSFLQRAPFLKPLRAKRVLLIGVGNVGAPIAMQLARAGVGHLDVVDYDLLQIGNTVRWPLGRRYAGQPKAAAIADAIRYDFPLSAVSPHIFRLGTAATHPEDLNNYDDLLRKLVARADLVVDGTASVRAAHLLSDLCVSSSKPYVWASTTHGVTGGIVGRIVPAQTEGCYNCFLRSWGQSIPKPPASPEVALVQPGGCTHPTFVGAGVDTDELAVVASRLVIATLCTGVPDAYPDFDWDIGVCALREDGRPLAPEWTTHNLKVHPSCRACNP